MLSVPLGAPGNPEVYKHERVLYIYLFKEGRFLGGC